MMRSVQFTKATIADLDYVAEVLESISPMYEKLLPGVFEQRVKKFRVAKKLPANYEIWLIINQNEPIGFFGIESLTSQVVYMAAFYLHNEYHSLHFGSRTLEKLCSLLEVDGYSEMVLFAHQSAYWAINFYQKNGFEIVTKDSQEISHYRQGILAGYFLPKPVLMRRDLKDNI